MSLDLSTDIDSCDVINLPKYCDYCKFLLVEELCLEDDYRLLHYGKCSVIGKVQRNTTGDILLENIRITNWPRESSIPEGTLTLHLLTFSYYGTHLQNGLYVEITGEVVLVNTKDPSANHQTNLTTRGITEQLNLLKTEQEQTKLLQYFAEFCKPAIKVWFVEPITRPGDLIQRNLELRMLQERF